MASIELDPKTGFWQVRFFLWGKQHKRSLRLRAGQDDRAEAERDRISDLVDLVKSGRVKIPEGEDVAGFVLRDGRQVDQTTAMTLDAAIGRYQQSLPLNAKEPTTIVTEKIHFKHLKESLGPRTALRVIGHERMQRYIDKRSATVAGETIRKEVATFRLLWRFCKRSHLVLGENPTLGLSFPRSPDKPPFREVDEVREIIARDGLSGKDAAVLWESSFLSVAQIREVLELVHERARHKTTHPAAAIAAWTGARRSEILRVLVQDVDLQGRQILLRDKKRVKGKSMGYRRVPLAGELAGVLEPHLGKKSGRLLAIKNVDMLTKRLGAALLGTPWEVLHGWHTFRHSFCSNLARVGTSQAMIDEWMGHSTEQQRRRYRHLFPADQAEIIDRLAGV